MSTVSLVGFSIVCLLLALSPGPDNIFVITQSVLYGWRAGIVITLGLCTGLIVHTAVVALGVGSLILAWPVLLLLIQFAGAIYLLYLAWQIWHSRASTPDAPNSPTLSGMQLYRRGVITNITNPKIVIFFLSLLPQFTTPNGLPVVIQLAFLGAMFITATLLVFISLALLAGTARNLFSNKAWKWINTAALCIFLVLAGRLIFSGTQFFI